MRAARPAVKRRESCVWPLRSSRRVLPFHTGLPVYSSARASAVFSFCPVPASASTRSKEVPRRTPGAIDHRFFKPSAASTSPPPIASRMRYSLKTRPSFMYSVSMPTAVVFWRSLWFRP